MVKSLLKEYNVKINDVLQKKTGNELEDLLIAERDRKDKAWPYCIITCNFLV